MLETNLLFDCRAPRSSGLRIPFAFHVARKRYVDASMVDSGENCGCVCPGCGQAVVAKHRRKRNVDHFAHLEKAECPGAWETSLHQAAKQVMSELDEISLPAAVWGPMPLFRFFSTKAEYHLRTFKPDVLACDHDNHELAIEIRVTHEVDLKKRERIKARSLDCVEFDLSKVSRLVTYESLVEAFRAHVIKSRWVYHHSGSQWELESARVRAEVAEEAARQAQLDREFEAKLALEKKLKAEAEVVEAKRKLEAKRWEKWGGRMDWARSTKAGEG